jgi:hypothetical protein
MDSKPDSIQPENPPSGKFSGPRNRFSHDRSLAYCLSSMDSKTTAAFVTIEQSQYAPY